MPELPRRPAIFALLFWSTLLVACVSYVFSLNREEHRFGPLLVALAVAAVAAAWVALPWDPRASRLRKLAAPAFLLCALAAGYFAGSVWLLGVYAAALANGVFIFGFGKGIGYAAVVLATVFGNYLMLLSMRYSELDSSITVDAVVLTAIWVPVAVFVIGVCAAIAEAVGRREEARTLLDELRTSHTELEEAHAELGRRAARARELAIGEERARMAREVHDSVGHHLTAINLQLQSAARFWENDQERARERVLEGRQLALRALAEVRRSVKALKPPALEERSGPGALSALARSFEGTGLDVRFSVLGERRTLPEGVELALYRAMQEGLSNAAKHSNGRQVRARLVFGEDRVGLEVVDDGDGAPRGAPDDGFGLRALSERVEALGGTVATGGRPEGGFALGIALPTGQPVKPQTRRT